VDLCTTELSLTNTLAPAGPKIGTSSLQIASAGTSLARRYSCSFKQKEMLFT
jgi:hypothetical protein